MQWRENKIETKMSKLNTGECFEFDDYLYICLDDNLALNVINNRIDKFENDITVTCREAEIVFY